MILMSFWLAEVNISIPSGPMFIRRMDTKVVSVFIECSESLGAITVRMGLRALSVWFIQEVFE